MSILSDAMNGKTTWAQAAQRVESDVAKAFAGNAVATQAQSVILTDLKQAASNAIALADTALGALIAPAAVTVETATNALLISAIGPAATVVTPATDAAITTAANALKAEIDAAATSFRASLAPKAAPPAPQVAVIPSA